MFKEENRTWLYMVGIVVMFIILSYLSIQVVIPLIFGGFRPVLENPPEFKLIQGQNYVAQVKTNVGDFVIDLYETNSPQNVNNFVFLANSNYYDNLNFFRIVPGFLIQGGDDKALGDDKSLYGSGNPGYVVPDEINYKSLGLSDQRIEELEILGYRNNENVTSRNLKQFSVAMANDGPNTNGSQFFIILAENTDERIAKMDGLFTVIGEVIEGFNTVTYISNIPLDDPRSELPTPLEKINILDVIITPGVEE